jgi:hypothetical protein
MSRTSLDSKVKYFLLDQSKLQRCSDPIKLFCAVRSPKYRNNTLNLCIIVILIQNERNIRVYCQIRVHTNSILHMTTYVTDEQWVVSTYM